MKSFAILALSAVALAAPIFEKREAVYVTEVEEVWETVFTTTTIYVDPTDVPENTIGAFYEAPPAPVTTSTTPAAPAYTPPAAKPQVAAPAASSPAYVAPAPAAASPAPAASPESAYVAPAAPVYSAPAASAYSAPAASSPAAQPASGSYSGGSGKGDHTGDITYYDVEVGLGSCGTTATNSENVVALSHLDMNNGINPNANPLCGTMINIYSDSGVHQAKVFDTCPSCAAGSLDLPEPLFKAVAPNGDGRVKGITWSFA